MPCALWRCIECNECTVVLRWHKGLNFLLSRVASCHNLFKLSSRICIKTWSLEKELSYYHVKNNHDQHFNALKLFSLHTHSSPCQCSVNFSVNHWWLQTGESDDCWEQWWLQIALFKSTKRIIFVKIDVQSF